MNLFSEKYLKETESISKIIDPQIIENIATEIANIRERNGRLFFIGSGGGQGIQVMPYVISEN